MDMKLLAAVPLVRKVYSKLPTPIRLVVLVVGVAVGLSLFLNRRQEAQE